MARTLIYDLPAARLAPSCSPELHPFRPPRHPPKQEAQLQQGLLPYTVTVEQVAPGASQAHFSGQQQAQQQLYLQQQQAAAHAAAAAQHQAAAFAAAGGGRPAPSGLSLPNSVLALGGGGGGARPEVSAVSGPSTLAQQQQQQGAAPAPAGPQASGGSSGGAPKAADYLQRVAAASNYISPFTGRLGGAGAGRSGAPVVQLPGRPLVGPGGRGGLRLFWLAAAGCRLVVG